MNSETMSPAPEQRETCETFVASLIMSSTEGRDPWTVEDAAYNLREWRAEGWEDIPPDLTPEILAALWNDGIKRH